MSTPWSDGFYYSSKSPFMVTEVRGNTVYHRNLVELDYPELEAKGMTGTWTFGKFKETLKEIEEKTGSKTYDLEIVAMDGKFKAYGVIAEDGKSVTVCGMMGEVTELIWMSPEKQKEILDGRISKDSLIPPKATVQPDNQGKVLWLSGPPGAGKSTTAQYLAREKGWVYYEADCYFSSLDPFVPLDVPEPTMAHMKQQPIKVSFVNGPIFTFVNHVYLTCDYLGKN